VDHADAAERAGGDELAHAGDRQVIGVRMTDLQRHAGALRRLHHGLRLLDADRHRLLGQYVLSRRADLRDVLGMQLGRRRHIDRVDAVLSQHCGKIGMHRHPGFRRHRRAHVGGGLSHGGELELRAVSNRRQKGPAGRPHPDDADPNRPGHSWLLRASLATLAVRE
jgi:hypothetical protein